MAGQGWNWVFNRVSERKVLEGQQKYKTDPPFTGVLSSIVEDEIKTVLDPA